MERPMNKNFSKVTENPSDMITKEALQMALTRYDLASKYSLDKDVLEIGCGPGIGLGYLANRANMVVGGDYDRDMTRTAHLTHSLDRKIGVMQLDAHTLPFKNRSFDLALLYEAIYYLKDPGIFVKEIRRVLKSDGSVIICSVNKNWADFSPSPLSTDYYSVADLFELLNQQGFHTKIFGAFPANSSSLTSKFVSIVRRVAVYMNLIPGSMKSKKWLKRIFYGRLIALPNDLSTLFPPGIHARYPSMAMTHPIEKTDLSGQYKIIYAIGHIKQGDRGRSSMQQY